MEQPVDFEALVTQDLENLRAGLEELRRQAQTQMGAIQYAEQLLARVQAGQKKGAQADEAAHD